MPDDHVLVCAPADTDYVVEGAKFDRRCDECGALVVTSPTGQKLIAREPGLAAGSVEDAIAELKTYRPNMRRRRN